MKHTNKVIIIGASHHNTLSMVRSFGEEGKQVTLFIYGCNKSYIASSIFIEEIRYFAEANETICALHKLCCESTNKPIVIACSDEVSSKMDLMYDDFISICYFFNAGTAGRITQYMNKQLQLSLAKKCGFNTPFSIEVLPTEVDIPNIQYPCLIKPKESIHGGKNISICHNYSELQISLKKYQPEVYILIQDYIKKEYEIVILGLSVNGITAIPGYIYKHRETNGGTTFGTVRPINEIDHSIVIFCEKMMKEISYTGLWGIECIKHDDKYYFIELNMRNDATTYALKVAGTNLPYHFYTISLGENNNNLHSHIRTISSMVEFEDFNFVLKGKVNPFVWWSQYNRAECKYYYSVADLKPCVLKKKEYMNFLKKRIFKF